MTGPSGTTSVHVDALGELARVNDPEVFWNSAAHASAPVSIGGGAFGQAPGVIGTPEGWHAAGWRQGRGTGDDPWSVASAAQGASWSVGRAGELTVGGLEWLGARAYDPSSRGFLSVDPLDPVTGTGWAHNPYSYAGNNPLHALDPTGLRPVTDAELRAYKDANQGALAAAGDWMKNNWEYVAGGAMVIAGGVLMATGVGGPAGMMLISAGADTIIQKATTGKVDWTQVALTGALGGCGGAGVAAKFSLTGGKAVVVAGMSSGGLGGAATSGYQYLRSPGPHSAAGFLSATAGGGATGMAFGAAGGAAGNKVASKLMAKVTSNPSANTMAMGRLMSARVEPYALANGYGYYKALPQPIYNATQKYLPEAAHDAVHLWANKKWINYQMAQGKYLVDIGAPAPLPGKPALGPSPFYEMELQQVAGYPRYSTHYMPEWAYPGVK